MQRHGTVKMKDVAERAGVSIMTVSLVLRGKPSGSRISHETRQRVLEAAKEFNYLPNARGRALRSGYTDIIGLYTGYGPVNMRLPFYVEIVSGLQEGCEQFRKDLLFYGLFHGQDTKDIFTELVNGRVDGLVVNMPPDDPMVERFVDSRFPVVAVANPVPNVPSVVVDDANGSRLIADYLYRRGYKRFLYLNCGTHFISTLRRRDAFLQTMHTLGLEVEERDWPTNSWSDFLLELRASKKANRPMAIVCWNDTSAYDLIADCQRNDIRVPDDVAIVGFDGCGMYKENVWELTTIRAPWAEAARTATQYLDALLKGQPVPMETILPVELIPGHTA